jgi:hypothetical protein
MRAYRNSQRQEEAVIWLSNSKNSSLKPFKGFEELSDYFKRVEYLTGACFDHSLLDGKWDFVYQPHRRLASVISQFKDVPLSVAEREAYESDCDLIEVYSGNSRHPEQYVVTTNLNICDLMREWCFDYAYAHGFTVLETFACELPNDTGGVCGPSCRSLSQVLWGVLSGMLTHNFPLIAN